jgi:hypothetical protein
MHHRLALYVAGFREIEAAIRTFYCQNAIKHRHVFRTRVWVFLKRGVILWPASPILHWANEARFFYETHWNAACRTDYKIYTAFSLCVYSSPPLRTARENHTGSLGVFAFNKPETFTHSARMEEMPARKECRAAGRRSLPAARDTRIILHTHHALGVVAVVYRLLPPPPHDATHFLWYVVRKIHRGWNWESE